MKYFEVLYTNCFGTKIAALIATSHNTPEEPTSEFNFNWNGNTLVEYKETTQQHYRANTYCFYK